MQSRFAFPLEKFEPSPPRALIQRSLPCLDVLRIAWRSTAAGLPVTVWVCVTSPSADQIATVRL